MQIYSNKNIFITGHTGFKGSWLGQILNFFGARLFGYSLKPYTTPNHFELLDSEKIYTQHTIGDICDLQNLEKSLLSSNAHAIFHLAAQPLVRQSYRDILQTFHTNAIGTLNLLQVINKNRDKLPNLKAVVLITTDKVYDNKEWVYGYREIDALGGYDPYSASKACAEIIAHSMRSSFFNLENFGKTHQILVATARAGNVIGGGDWSDDRLIPDLMRNFKAPNNLDSINSESKSQNPAIIRNPHATRPWQHALEPLRGYLMLGERLLNSEKEFASSFNFGPSDEGNISVQQMLEIARSHWGALSYRIQSDSENPHEAQLLMLDSSKARNILGWRPIFDSAQSIERTISWYRAFYEQGKILTCNQIKEFFAAKNEGGGGLNQT